MIRTGVWLRELLAVVIIARADIVVDTRGSTRVRPFLFGSVATGALIDRQWLS